MAESAIVILFNPSQTEFLVGKETKWVSDIDTLRQEDTVLIRSMFSRAVRAPLAHNDPDEIIYYTQQTINFMRNPIMDRINPHAATVPARITFGDVEYKTGSGSYSFVRPRFLPHGRRFKFPGGGLKPGVDSSLQETALREFFEESGIDLAAEPFTITKLLDTGSISNGYRVFYYITNEEEYLRAKADIHAKNISANGELHELEFIKSNRLISEKARNQYTKTPKGTPVEKYKMPSLRTGIRTGGLRKGVARKLNKTRGTKQRCRTRRSRR